MDHLRTANDTLPFINSHDYLDSLAQRASLCEIRSAIVVVGPKSSGKSEGFKQVIPKWKESGHTVLDIDLKGKESNVSSPDIMWSVAREIVTTFYSLDYQAQQCLFDTLSYKCVNGTLRGPWWSFLSALDNHRGVTYTVLTGIITSVLAFIRDWLSGNLKRAFLLLAMLLLLLILLGYFINWYSVAEIVIHPVQESISSGDWYALSCSANAISKCAPEHRPILIVRELTNLNSESLNAFLRSLEQMKQGDIHYPVFAESSDFLWAHKSPVIKSSDSFIMYHIHEMTREEGLSELVHRLNIWTEEEYDEIYGAIGGHLGSYRLLYDYNKIQKYSLNESIGRLKGRAYDQVLATTGEGNRTAIENWIQSLKRKNYKMTVAEIPEDIWVLFESNVLFRDSKYVYPQNKLMEHAIDDYSRDFLMQTTQ